MACQHNWLQKLWKPRKGKTFSMLMLLKFFSYIQVFADGYLKNKFKNNNMENVLPSWGVGVLGNFASDSVK